jgi:hypothetical protein
MSIDRAPNGLDVFRRESPRSGYKIGGIPYTMYDMTQEKMIVFRY